MSIRIQAIVLVLLGATPTADAELPPEIKADKYLEQAKRLQENRNHRAAVDMMDMIVDLQKEHKFKFPEEFYFRYAQMALPAGRFGTAIKSVKKYLSTYGRRGKYYQEALDLLNQIQQQSLPLKQEKVTLVRPAFGWGITRLTDDFVDFKMEDDHILTENDSKSRSQLMTGGLINFYEFKNKNTIDIALNVEFAVGGDYVDGFFIGGGFGLGRKLEFIFGYSLGRGTELSHGFQRTMGQFIKKHKGDRRYPEFKGIHLVDGVIADIRDYDGLPLSFVNHRGETQKIFPGEPTIDSFNSKWSFGILIPLDIWKSIKAAAKDDK